ncbi:restriction endonuclease [Nocardia abscessus]|uniref:restriction endonuclease n=1 Tax=Nocardia abscessus TaxID=120957 RepID=UPI002455F4AC|nr:restriction endonuclease [Nocardia abscessus]
MEEIDPVEIRRYLHIARTAPDTDAQGKAYEDLAFYLFDSIPGCFAEGNGVSHFRSEQVDVGVCNAKHQDGLHALPHVILVECKNWSHPVDSSTLGYFVNILANRCVETGILIAANGITGDRHDYTNAHALGVSAIARGIKILVITTEELEKLTCTADFVELLLRRFLLAYMRGGVGVP